MFSVVIGTHNHEDALARTLASMVTGAVEGVVREVIVFDTGSTDRTQAVADHAGCRYLPAGSLAEAMALAKGDWLMLVEPGARLVDGWIEPVLEHVASSRDAAFFSRADEGIWAKLTRLFGTSRPLARGLMITKGEARNLVGLAITAERLARAVRAGKLSAKILPATS